MQRGMILVGLGANLPHPVHGSPRSTLAVALAMMEAGGVVVARRSRLYRTPPVPPSDQPWFVNQVAVVETSMSPAGLLSFLHTVEQRIGRRRSVRNAARTVDLDLLAYGDRVEGGGVADQLRGRLVLPHPRLAERAFWLVPIAEVAPGWRHPATGAGAAAMLAALPDRDAPVPMDGDPPGAG